ncbi:MAG: hypothetical protein HYV67_01620 [Candidatus Taylorbacteria bacterium]|nr:hypothetical protein [Candidatus Taylorbacteria bacterium]
MPEIIPAIIPKNLEDLEEKMSNVRALAPLVQVDVLDGSLVPARSWPYQSPKKRDAFFDAIIREEQGFPFWQEMEFEAHFMVRAPETKMADWIAAGASLIIIQVEGVADFDACVSSASGRIPLGVSIALDTPIETVAPLADRVLVIQSMGWNFSQLGFQGRPFDERTIERVRQLRQEYPKHIISVDGGVNLETAPALVRAGASRLVVGSALWQNGALRENLAKFKKLLI